ncbi:unnamed protein product, partial [Mesorhabditis belari]|uniref:C-type lectin domain-containing protein n=1 Tax=Mesorhabditis belari TaxID=2138241 RepID=A0AAF3EIY5_9BILA
MLNETTCVYSLNTPQTFFEVSKQCAAQAYWAYPVRIRNALENKFLQSLAQTQFNNVPPFISIWKKAGDNWTYYDGTSPLLYQNWAPGEPSSTTNRDLCAVMSPTTGLWKSSECTLTKPYFCTVEIRDSQCDPGWIYNDSFDFCYYLQNFTMEGQDWKTWGPYETEPACQAMSPYSHLVSIHSKAEDDFVYSLARTFTFINTPPQYSPESNPCHYQGVSIGLLGSAVLGGAWTDGTKIDYLGQMDSPGDSANWMMQNDDSCSEKQWHAHGTSLVWCRFICKMPSNKQLSRILGINKQ